MSLQGFSLRKKLPDASASAEAMPTWRATLFTAFSILMVVAATASFGEAAVAPAHRVAALVMFGVTSIYFGGDGGDAADPAWAGVVTPTTIARNNRSCPGLAQA